MIKYIILIVSTISLLSCHSSRKIKSAVAPIDTTTQIVIIDSTKEDSLSFIRNVYNEVGKNRIDFKSFSAKIKVDYWDKDGKGPELMVIARIRKDSAIWISINATVFSYEAFRMLVTPDSVKVLNKKDKLVTLRSVSYLKEVANLPFDFYTLQDLIIGNPVFFTNNIVSFKKTGENVTVLSTGEFFKNLLTVNEGSFLMQNSKLDDINTLHNRTCYLAYGNYDTKNNISFATKRKISVSEKSKLDVDMDIKQYNFNEDLAFPFGIPKNYKVN